MDYLSQTRTFLEHFRNERDLKTKLDFLTKLKVVYQIHLGVVTSF